MSGWRGERARLLELQTKLQAGALPEPNAAIEQLNIPALREYLTKRQEALQRLIDVHQELAAAASAALAEAKP